MRKALNDNPIVTVIVIGVLGIGVAFLLISSMSSSSSSSSSSSTTPTSSASSTPATPAAAPTATAPSTAAPATTTPSTAPTDPSAATVDPTTGAPVTPAAAPAPAAPVGAFVAGPGLPAPVVKAYKQGDAVALLVVKKNGIDDAAVRVGYPIVTAIPRVATFETLATHVARYARIAEGVNLDRVPALVVIRPKSLTGSGPPQATVTYGFTGPVQLAQAVFDSLYKGAENLPYHPG
jgi:hypothetical protein